MHRPPTDLAELGRPGRRSGFGLGDDGVGGAPMDVDHAPRLRTHRAGRRDCCGTRGTTLCRAGVVGVARPTALVARLAVDRLGPAGGGTHGFGDTPQLAGCSFPGLVELGCRAQDPDPAHRTQRRRLLRGQGASRDGIALGGRSSFGGRFNPAIGVATTILALGFGPATVLGSPRRQGWDQRPRRSRSAPARPAVARESGHDHRPYPLWRPPCARGAGAGGTAARKLRDNGTEAEGQRQGS